MSLNLMKSFSPNSYVFPMLHPKLFNFSISIYIFSIHKMEDVRTLNPTFFLLAKHTRVLQQGAQFITR